jgi:hypothetical protein
MAAITAFAVTYFAIVVLGVVKKPMPMEYISSPKKNVIRFPEDTTIMRPNIISRMMRYKTGARVLSAMRTIENTKPVNSKKIFS